MHPRPADAEHHLRCDADMEWLKGIPEDQVHECHSFKLFGLEPILDLDDDLLERRYIQLSQWAHPDRNSDRQDWAMLVTARINQAYRELSQFRTRAESFFRIHHPKPLATDREMPHDFLMKVFQWNEQQQDGTLDLDEVEDAYDEIVDRLIGMSREPDWNAREFRKTLNQLTYFENLLREGENE